MNRVIIVRPDKCVGCNACIKNCPAPEANIAFKTDEGRIVTNINGDKCINCGKCVKTCTHGARDYLDDTEAFMSRIADEKCIVLVSPAIKTAFPTKWKGILDWFKKKGCIIFDVSLGADISTWAQIQMIESSKVGNMISQPCAAIVRYIEIYQPKLLMNLAPVHSPVGCSAIYLKKYLRRNNPIAVLSPCIAKKSEISETGLVDYNVTFKKLVDYFDRNDIKIVPHKAEELTYDFEEQQGQLGGIYSRPGGLKDNLLSRNPELNILNSEGVHRVYPELDVYAQLPEYKHPQVFDVLSCEYGCNLGPGSGSSISMFDARTIMNDVEKEAKSRQKTSGIRTKDDRLFKKFDEELKVADFMRSYKPLRSSPLPTNKQLEDAFTSLGKTTRTDRRIDCRSCGYNSCRDMAIAICRKLNIPDNCIMYTRTLIANGGTAQNTDTSAIAEKCLDLSEQLRNNLSSITENMDTISDSTTKTGNRADVVNELLQNVIDFCRENKTMDEESVEQMIEILTMTTNAFSSLNENVSTTNQSSAVIKESVSKINSLVDEIRSTLGN